MREDGVQLTIEKQRSIASDAFEVTATLCNSGAARVFSEANFFLGLHYGNWYSGIPLKPRTPLPLQIGTGERAEILLLRGSGLPDAKKGPLIVPTPPSGECDLRGYGTLAELAQAERVELGVIFTYLKPYEVLLPRERRFWRKRKSETRYKEERISSSLMLTPH